MCMLERKKLNQEQQVHFRVASFDMESSSYEKFVHCLRRHSKESGEMAKLPRSMLLEMQKGLAKTERDEDFDLDYTLMH
ncbi:hypothetical protein C0992_004594 [Termitomyces sp. T32_za158]|nr:hypothetical protein C0992_004594 [Termitomyces sp. T32_za158]